MKKIFLYYFINFTIMLEESVGFQNFRNIEIVIKRKERKFQTCQKKNIILIILLQITKIL